MARATVTPLPAWSIQSVAGPTNFVPGDESGEETYKLYVTNLGSLPTDGSTVTITDTLPSGVKPVFTEGREYKAAGSLTCTTTPVQCTYGGAVPAGDILEMDISVAIEPSASGIATNAVSVTGGGAAAASISAQNPISAALAPFAFNDFGFGVSGLDGAPDTQAGAHPYAVTTRLDFNTQQIPSQHSIYVPSENVKDVVVDLPLGFVGNALTAPQCPLDKLEPAQAFNTYECPANTKIGEVTLRSVFGEASSVAGSNSSAPVSPLFNMVPEHGHPAEFGFAIGEVARVHLYASVVGTSAGYVLRVSTPDSPAQFLYSGQQGFLAGITLTFFGDPAIQDGGGTPPAPFFTNPVDCSASGLATTVHVDTWTHKGRVNPDGTPDFSDPTWIVATSALPPVSGCNALQFNPTIALTPDSTRASSPTGVSVDLKVPQGPSNDAALATPELKDATVTLPAGLAVSPSAADGLQGCSDAQIALSSTLPAACPEASQVGTVKVHTPLLADPLEGQVYLGTPNCGVGGLCSNADAQSGNMIRLFIQVQGAGVVIKLPGTVSLDPDSGQLTATFKNNPQLPFDELTLAFKRGPRAALSTPQTCGSYTTTSSLTPWSAPESGPPATPSSSFNITSGCTDGFAPSFSAGTTNNQAGGFSPFSVTFSRGEEDQTLSGVTVRTPPGLLGVLKSVVQCPEPQASQGACGPQSLIGHTTTGAGPGTNPFYLGGSVFLTGPYKDAPFGLSIVVPAVAGPFNLGNVIVRAAIHIDPHTSALTVTSDPLPTILDGIPLQIRTVNVTVDRPGFMFNPTNCNPLALTATLTSVQGASAGVWSPFQAANCANLPFSPQFTVQTQAKTSKANGASLHVKVASGAGQANIAKVRVTLPKQLPSRLTTLQKACVDSVFDANPAACPAGSLVGTATAITPVLNNPLIGPAYLVSHGGAAFPDLVIVLQGEGITLFLDGNTNIKKGITTSTFNSLPDAPISSFDLVLPEGPHAVLAANGSLCAKTLTMPTTITGQNGAQVKQTTRIAVSGCPKHKAKKARKAAAKRHGKARRR